MKIGFFISNLRGGGAERVFLNLVNKFQENNIPVLLILRHKRGVYLPQLNPKVNVVELKTNNPLIIVYRLINVSITFKIDVLFSSQRYNNVLSLLAKPFMNSKVIIREASTLDGILNSSKICIPLLAKIKNQAILILMKLLYPIANLIICNSFDTFNDIISVIKVKNRKVKVIYNPLVDDNIMSYGNQDVNDNRFEKLTKPIIISVGRFSHEKNYEHLIRSFRLVISQIPAANLVILGKGPEMKKIITLCTELLMTDKVHMLGFVNNPYKYLRNSDLFVLSSRYEGFGNVIVEALAMGLPVVSTNCPGGPKDILDNGKYGILVPLENVDALAAAIIGALKSENDKNELIKRSKEYSIDTISDQYYNEIRFHSMK